jgi:hypothetical protein
VQNTLDTLRAQARPTEERAVNSKFQNLFSRGTLGSTSGARAIGELALAQEQADIGRQIAAQQVGMQQFGQLQNAGQGLLGLGANQLLAGSQNQQNLAQLLGAQGLSNINSQRDFLGTQFNAQQGVSSLMSQRPLERLQAAQGLFGFGQQAAGTDLQQAISGINARLAMNADLRNLVALGGNIGGQQASAGAQAAQYINQTGTSPLGAGLSGIGTGLFNAGLNQLFPTV